MSNGFYNKKFLEKYKKLGLDLEKYKFLGQGHHGKVFMREDGKVIKICDSAKNCRDEYVILRRINGGKYFPKVYEYNDTYMVRDYVGGICMKDYIKKNGLSKRLILNIIELLEEFKRIHFKKIDIRCKDIFVQKDEEIMIIDPKGCFTRRKSYPSHLMKGLKKLLYLDKFIMILKDERPDLYVKWIISKGIKTS